MISQEYLNNLTFITGMGYSEHSKDALMYFIKHKFVGFQKDYRLQDITTEGLEEDAIDLAWLGYNLVSRLTGKSLVTLVKEATQLHKDKNAGYSGNNPDPWINFRYCSNFGINPIDGILTRLCDKYMRLVNLYDNPELDKVGEKIEDTLMDFSAYLIIFAVMIQENNGN